MSAARRNVVIVVAVIAILGLVVGSYLLGRGRGAATPTASSGTSGQPSQGSTTQGTAASGALPRGMAASTGGGSKTGPEGVVLGYPHTPEGAVSAVTNYAMIITLPRIADPKVAAAIAESIAAPGSTDAVVEELRGWAELTSDQYLLSGHPSWGAYAVVSYNDNEALVAVWWPTVFSKAPGYSPLPEGKVDNFLGPVWEVNVYRVVWAQGDWKWLGFVTGSNAGENLDPRNPDAPPTSQEKSEILHRPNPLTSLNDVGYQAWDWMEYADA